MQTLICTFAFDKFKKKSFEYLKLIVIVFIILRYQPEKKKIV